VLQRHNIKGEGKSFHRTRVTSRWVEMRRGVCSNFCSVWKCQKR